MPIPSDVIQEAVARYERERDRYLKLAARVADICRAEIVEANAIRAQVTSRTKTARSFEGKLRRFAKRPDKDMPTVDVVFEQIGDFAGVRVATYRPEDEARVAEELRRHFRGINGGELEIDLKDKLSPKEGQFYRATHCQACLPDEELIGDYENLRGTNCEIQICSMMAHVWNEIEHDIAYKPEGGGPGAAEKGLLEALGHLARSGDAAITRLLEANEARLKQQTGDFVDVYDFVARLRSLFPEADLSLHAGQLFDEAQALGLTTPERLKQGIGEDNFDLVMTRQKVADFNRFLAKNGEDDFVLQDQSSDLILVLLLEKHAERIEANHPAGRGKGRPPRIRSIAKRYREYEENQRGENAPAA